MAPAHLTDIFVNWHFQNIFKKKINFCDSILFIEANIDHWKLPKSKELKYELKLKVSEAAEFLARKYDN